MTSPWHHQTWQRQRGLADIIEGSPLNHLSIYGFNFLWIPLYNVTGLTVFSVMKARLIFWAPVSFEQRPCQHRHNALAVCNLRLNIWGYWYWCQASKTTIGQTQVTSTATARGQRKQMPVQFMNSSLRGNRAVSRDRLQSPCHQPLQGKTSWFVSISYLLNRCNWTRWTTSRTLKQRSKAETVEMVN